MDEIARATDVAEEAGARTQQLITALGGLDEWELHAPSRLPGWSRLTIVCHLRYGTHALWRMTQDTLAGRPTAYYPDGRAVQRPRTLAPAPGERPTDVLEDWRDAAIDLDNICSRLQASDWTLAVSEPLHNPDLGTIPLARLALARLTEVDVHGTDLDIGVPDWSPTLVEVALATRLSWISARRTNHRAFDRTITGSWLLIATDGPRWLITVEGERVSSRPAADDDEDATATICGSSRDLLALLLGRPRRAVLRLSGDINFGRSFERALPGP